MGNGPSVDKIEVKFQVRIQDVDGHDETIPLKFEFHPHITLSGLIDKIADDPDFMETLKTQYNLNRNALKDARKVRVMYNGEPTALGDLEDMAASKVVTMASENTPELTIKVMKLMKAMRS
jgi:hypothetical protein